MNAELATVRRKLQVTGKHHDVIAVAVSDPRELELPAVGRLTVEDAETGEMIEINTNSASVRQAYQASSIRRRETISKMVRSLGMDLLEFASGSAWLPELLKFFRKRRHRAA